MLQLVNLLSHHVQRPFACETGSSSVWWAYFNSERVREQDAWVSCLASMMLGNVLTITGTDSTCKLTGAVCPQQQPMQAGAGVIEGPHPFQFPGIFPDLFCF